MDECCVYQRALELINSKLGHVVRESIIQRRKLILYIYIGSCMKVFAVRVFQRVLYINVLLRISFKVNDFLE